MQGGHDVRHAESVGVVEMAGALDVGVELEHRGEQPLDLGRVSVAGRIGQADVAQAGLQVRTDHARVPVPRGSGLQSRSRKPIAPRPALSSLQLRPAAPHR